MREMKDSGIEWIGNIPIQWSTLPIRFLLSEHISGSWGNDEQHNDNDRICVRIADFDYSKIQFKENIDYTIRNYSTYEIYYKTLQIGDLLIEKSGGGEKTPVGRTVVYRLPYNALFANFMDCIRLKPEYNVEYIKYAFWALYNNGITNLYYNQTTGIQNLNMTKYFREVKLTIPSIEEQVIVSNFLDERCTIINSLISDIQSQIEVLEEYKKSLVFHVVSNGTRKSKLQNTISDVWLTIPENWKLVDIKYLFEIIKRIAGQEGFDILSVTQKGLKVKDISTNEGQIAESYAGYQFVYPTDYVMNHMDLLTGWVDCSTMFGVTSPDYRVFRLRDKENNDLTYFKYVMQCCYMSRIFYSLGQGVSNLGRWRLQTSAFNNFMIPVPPLEEQCEIAEYLDTKISEIDTIIADKQKQIETIEEYKKSLIFEYVTGKKEVEI